MEFLTLAELLRIAARKGSILVDLVVHRVRKEKLAASMQGEEGRKEGRKERRMAVL